MTNWGKLIIFTATMGLFFMAICTLIVVVFIVSIWG